MLRRNCSRRKVQRGIEEAYSFNVSPRDRRQIRKIIYEHFEYIEQQWAEFQQRRR